MHRFSRVFVVIAGVSIACTTGDAWSAGQQPVAPTPAAASAWKYSFPPARHEGTAPSAMGQRAQVPWWSSPQGKENRAQPSPREHLLGYPAHTDPLFEDGTRPAYPKQHFQWPQWDRPTYDPPAYSEPSWRQDPIRKPVYQEPLLIPPNNDKPRYRIEYEQPPAYIKPTQAMPAFRGPGTNYVIEPYDKPAYKRPGYDRSQIPYDRPQYRPPAYPSRHYEPPRYLPPPYIAPPK